MVNAGSSSLKLSEINNGRRVAEHTVERWDGSASVDVLQPFLDRCGDLDAVGHRVVHGGPNHLSAETVGDDLLAYLDSPDNFAPMHNTRAAAGIRAVTAALPRVSAVACFDTTFHRSLPPAAATYAIPRDWAERWSLRRYGAHGLSHAYANRRAAELINRPVEDLKMVICHLGSGASLAAVDGGRSIDTTMGLTPMEGLVMATRSGTLDPGLVTWVARHGGLDIDQIEDALQHESGLKALSGTSGDLREVLVAADNVDPAAALAYDVFVHRLRREIGAMTAVLGDLDVLVFTGGIGEHVPRVRRDAVAALGFMGARLNDQLNEIATSDANLSSADSTVTTLVVSAAEDLEVARQVDELLTPAS